MMKPAIAALCLAAGPAAAVEVSRELQLNAAPADVWAEIGAFCAIADWHPAVATCAEEEIDGTTHRRLSLEGGGELLERRAEAEGETAYGYEIVEGPLPVANYTSTFGVSADGDGALLTWSSQFDAAGATDDEAAEVIGGIYDAGLAAIAERFAD